MANNNYLFYWKVNNLLSLLIFCASVGIPPWLLRIWEVVPPWLLALRSEYIMQTVINSFLLTVQRGGVTKQNKRYTYKVSRFPSWVNWVSTT